MKQLKLSDLKFTKISNVMINGIHYDKFYEYVKPYYAIITEHEYNKGRSSRVYILIAEVLRVNVDYYLCADFNKNNIDFINLKQYNNFNHYCLFEDQIEFITESIDDINKFLMLE
jgi:hypothetical protein